MAIKGESIGTAFVRLLIDGKGIPKDVRKALAQSDKDFEDAGGHQGRLYANELNESMEKHRPKKGEVDKFLSDIRLRSRFVMGEVGRDSGDSFFGEFRTSVRKQFGEGRFAEAFIADFERDFARAGGGFDFTKLFDQEGNVIASAAATREWTKRIEEATAAVREQDTLLDRQSGEMRKRFELLRTETARITKAQIADFEDVAFSINKVGKEAEELRENFEHLSRGLSPSVVAEYHKELSAIERKLVGTRPAVIEYRRQTDKLGTVVGKTFGRNSRSELLNFFGVLAERGVRSFFKIGEAVLSLPGRLAQVQRFFAGIGEAAGFGVEGVSMLTKFAGAGRALAAAFNPATLAAVVAAIGALALAMGFLISVVVALAGALTSLLVTALFGLVGGLGIAVGAVVPLVAGIGVLVAGIKSMDEATQAALTNALNPLKETFKELGAVAAENIFGGLDVQVKSIADTFKSFEVTQFVDQISLAVRGVMDQFALMLTSGGFKDFLTILSDTMPEQIENLGSAMLNFGAGFGGVFIAIQPLITSFTEGLATMAARFNAFANNDAGQQKIHDFFALAARAARAVGGLIFKIGEALYTVFVNGAGEAGIDLFNRIKKKVQELIDYVKKNPEAIKSFFRDARDIAAKLGSIMDHILDALAKFGSKEHRDDAMKLLNIIDNVAAAFEAVATAISHISFSKIASLIAKGLGPGGATLDALAKATNSANGQRNFVGGWSWVGEQGPELMYVPRHSNIYSNPESRAMVSSASGGSSSVTIHQNYYGPTTGSERLREMEWTMRYGTRFGGISAA